MYVRHANVKYYVDMPVEDYKKNPLPIRCGLDYIKVTAWLGSRQLRTEKCEDITDKLIGIPCLAKLEGYPISSIIKTPYLVEQLHKKEPPSFTVGMKFDLDVLAHTEAGFKQELISMVVEPDFWGKVQVLAWKLVGIEMPKIVYINFSLALRKK